MENSIMDPFDCKVLIQALAAQLDSRGIHEGMTATEYQLAKRIRHLANELVKHAAPHYEPSMEDRIREAISAPSVASAEKKHNASH